MLTASNNSTAIDSIMGIAVSSNDKWQEQLAARHCDRNKKLKIRQKLQQSTIMMVSTRKQQQQ